MEELSDTLISQVYRASLNALPWPTLLEGVRRQFAAEVVALLHPGQPPIFTSPADEGATRRDPAAEQALTSPSLMRALQASRERTYMAEAAPNPLPWHRLAIALDAPGPDRRFVICLRPAHQRPFTAQDRTLGERLARHFSSARSLAGQLVAESVSHELLNRLHFAFLCVDDAGQILCCDEMMRTLLDSGKSLTLASGGLGTQVAAETRRLRQILKLALSPEGGASSMMQITDTSRPLPLTTLVMPARNSEFSVHSGRTAAWVVVCNQEGPQPELVAVQAQSYGLTDAETRLVYHLLNGLSVRQCATVLEVSQNTVRWHLKRIFHKTGVTSQTALIRTFLTCPAFQLRQP